MTIGGRVVETKIRKKRKKS